MSRMDSIIAGYQQWIDRLLAEDRQVWFFSLMFRELRVSDAQAMDIMQQNVERMYRILLTRIVRKPRGEHRDIMPVLIGLPDRPVAKRRPTQKLAELLPNNGLHYHFLYGLPASSHRLQGRFRSLVNDLHQQLCGNDIEDLDVRRYKPPAPGQAASRIADYTLKQMKREPAMADQVLILPTDYQQPRTPELPRPVCYPG
jgi:hypothetical protein